MVRAQKRRRLTILAIVWSDGIGMTRQFAKSHARSLLAISTSVASSEWQISLDFIPLTCILKGAELYIGQADPFTAGASPTHDVVCTF